MNLQDFLESVDESRIVKFNGGGGFLFVWTSGEDEEPQAGQQESVQLEAFGDLPDILTIGEVTEVLRISRTLVCELVRQDQLVLVLMCFAEA